MAINVVYEYAGHGHLRHFFAKLMRCLGVILILAGLTASMLPLLFLVFFALSAAQGKPMAIRNEDLPTLGGACLVMIVCLIVGRALLRGRRRPVLFLRRFGFGTATEVVTFALATAVGNSWRLITLDDHRVSPVGAGRRARWSSAIVGIVTISLIAAVLFWLFSGGLGDMVSGAMKSDVRSGSVAGDIVGAILAGLAVAIIMVILIIVAASILMVFAIFSVGTYFSVRRAERSKKLNVSGLQRIDPMVRSVMRRSRKVFSPKLMVVRVAEPAWQQTVGRLALVCSAIVIDVSEPTPNLIWEIESLKPHLRLRWILVAEQGHLNRFATRSGQNQPLILRLFELLDGEDVLAYSSDSQGRKRFARALRAKLELQSS